MKKIVYTIITGTIVAFTLNSCNNAEEIAKQKEAENANIQKLVDEKLSALQTEAEAVCAAKVDSTATALYDEWYAKEGKKKGAKPAVKPKPAPTPTPTPAPTVGDGKPKMGEQDPTKVGDGKPKMGEQDPTKVGNGKPKMGGN
ncbi:MAG: hypothetical protein JNK66_03675 [Chitinophagales bacterium]|nr:hypothetical protein [Chitinophagales bacterium]